MRDDRQTAGNDLLKLLVDRSHDQAAGRLRERLGGSLAERHESSLPGRVVPNWSVLVLGPFAK